MKSEFQRDLEDNIDLLKERLGDDYFKVGYHELDINERKNGRTRVNIRLDCDVMEDMITSNGDGPVDAIWDGYKGFFSKRYDIIDQIEFTGFVVSVEGFDQDVISSDANVMVEIQASNDFCNMFVEKESDSIIKASIKCINSLFEYLINSEMAFDRLQELVKDAEERDRQDLKSKHINEMSKLTKLIPHKRSR